MVQFRPAAERGRFDPPVVEDFSQAMSADSQRRIAQLAEANRQQERLLQQEVENAKRTTQNDAALQTLATFSKTAAEYVQKNAEQTAKDIQDGQDWDYMFGGDNPASNLAEEVASEAAEMQLAQTQQTTNELDQRFGKPVGNAFYNRNAGIGKGLQNERALLINARNRYPAFLMEFRASQTPVTIGGVTKTADQWAQSTDAAVIGALQQQARYQFIKENGLQYTTKRNFVKYMMETMLSAEGNGATNILNTNIQRERSGNAALIGGNLSDSFQNTNDYGKYSEMLLDGIKDYTSGNTGMDFRAANKAAVSAALNGIMSRKDYDAKAIAQLGGVYLRYDEDGNPIKGTQVEDYPELGKLLRDAEEDMIAGQDREDRRGAKEALADGIRHINKGATPDERARRKMEVEGILDQFGVAGQDALRTLNQRAPSLELGPDAAANQTFLNRAYQVDGFNPNDDFIDYAEQNGLVGSEFAKKMRERNKIKQLPAGAAKNYLNDTNKFIRQGAAEAIGAEIVETATGSYFKTEQGQFISDSTLNRLMTGLARQREEIARSAYYGTDGTDQEKIKAVKKALDDFDALMAKDPRNIYNFDALKGANLTTLTNPKITKLLKDVGALSAKNDLKGIEQRLAKEKALEPLSPEERLGFYHKVNQLRSLSDEKIKEARAALQAYHENLFKPQDWSQGEIYTQDNGITKLTPDVVRDFNLSRGDTLFTEQVTTEYIEFAKDTKNSKAPFHPDLVRFADQLGVNAGSLLMQQAQANGMPPKDYILPSVTAPAPQDPNRQSTDPSVDADGNVIRIGDQVGGGPVSDQVYDGMGGPSLPDNHFTPYEGAQWFMRAGYSVRGASYLSGNINTESNWIPNRPPWNDVGAPAGGLASWRAERLTKLENYFGRPVQRISTEDQLKYMVHELSSNPYYAEADRIFRMDNPTQRQLIRASKIFWGYGVEGDRYTNAERIYSKVNAK